MSANSLDLFDIVTKQWFSKNLGTPTAVQQEAWPAIALGKHTLVSAPTGTGKTLSAFLVFIDQLKEQSRKGILKQELQLIYISPLKSLAGDIRENLRRPLNGIFEEERSLNPGTRSMPYDITVAIRTGDTSTSDRRSMIKTPPHILITTPESLYLMLTSKSGQSILHTAKAIIIDELHAIIDTKRGAHLMLSLARLDKLCNKPLQRIGLSATIEPLSKAAEYLSPDPVTIVSPNMHKQVELIITSPMLNSHEYLRNTVWEEVARTVYEHCTGTRSVIAFVEGRAYAEKLAYYVNQIAGEGFARTHHGSLSKEQRFIVEQSLREGTLRLLCATSSMELGIDVGDIDQVFQIGTPRSISSTLQRLGRAGHNPGRVSIMHIFPREASEGLYCGLTAEVVRNGGIECSKPPRLCLDVLAQHLVSMATISSYDIDEVMEILSRAYPFYEVTKQDVKDVLCMLAGDYEHEQEIPVRPRILYDRIHDYVEGDTYSRMLAVSAGGTIPDKGMYTLRTEDGVKVGELDEEFVFEARIGDRFLLGSFAWKISRIQKDVVIVTGSTISGARLPFWKGEVKGRCLQTGIAFGRIFNKLFRAYEVGELYEELQGLGLDEVATKGAEEFLTRQINATKVLPDDKTILIEHFSDETGNHQVMVHSVFGKQVNAPLSLLTSVIAKGLVNTNINFVDDDDGFLLFPYDGCSLPEGLLQRINPDTARPILTALLPSTSLFNITFRYNAGRALMMGVKNARRQPLWVQRLRSSQMLDSVLKEDKHPLIRETKRECLEDHWDLEGVEFVLNGIRSGTIQVHEMYMDTPSPMSLPLRRQTEASMMYDYAPTPHSIHRATEDALQQVELAQAGTLIAPAKEQLKQQMERRRLPQDENQLHSLLMIEGDLIAGEVDVPIDWFESLARKERVKYIEPGLWIAAEHSDAYQAALEDKDVTVRMDIVRRVLRYRQAQSLELIAERYLFTDGEALEVLEVLCRQGSIVESDGLYYHAELYDRARKETVKSLRRQIRTLPAERYAALITSRIRSMTPAKEQLEKAMKVLCDQAFPPEVWEDVLLPARVSGYRPELLDELLARGDLFWRITSDMGISFHLYNDINWDEELSSVVEELVENEKIIYEALLKRGASFAQRLSPLLSGVSPYDILLNLAEKGLVSADSFVPARQWMAREKQKKITVRQKVTARVKAMSAGRWEVLRPLKELTIEELLERLFDKVIIVCRETTTIQGASWNMALETLRVWEYTGRVRRGYFIEGLSGIQFIRTKDFEGVMTELVHPRDQVIWISAVDTAQPWGKSLPHMKDRSFHNVAGTTVALRSGVPIAVFERQGKVLRIFDSSNLQEVLRIFSQDFKAYRILPKSKRITVKEYQTEAVDSLIGAGFSREMQDYVLYR